DDGRSPVARREGGDDATVPRGVWASSDGRMWEDRRARDDAREVTAGDDAASMPLIDPLTRPRDGAAPRPRPRDEAPRWAPNGYPLPQADWGSRARDTTTQPREEGSRGAPSTFPPPPPGYYRAQGYNPPPGFAWSPGYSMPPVQRYPVPGFGNPG